MPGMTTRQDHPPLLLEQCKGVTAHGAMPDVHQSTALFWAVVLLMSILVLLLDYRPLHDPIANDAALFSIVAQVVGGETTHPSIDLEHGQGIWHPMLYQLLLNGLAKAVGSDVIYARILGLGCGLLTASLLAWLVVLMIPGSPLRRWIVVLAVATYVTNPFGRLGMLHLDIDNTVLPPIMLAATGLVVIVSRQKTFRGVPYLVTLQALGFWAKLTTPLLLPFALAGQMLLERRGWKSLWLPLGITLGGGMLFYLTWWAYCAAMGYPATIVFAQTMRVLSSKASEFNVLSTGRFAWGLVYWLIPAFLLLAVIMTVILIRDRIPCQLRKDLLAPAFLGWSIVVGYLFVGGITFTIPKYQYPAIPLLSLIVAVAFGAYIKAPAPILRWAGAILAGLALYYYALGDPLLHYFYSSRVYLLNMKLSGEMPQEYLRVLLTDLLLVLLPILICAGSALFVKREERRSHFVVLLFLVMFGYSMGLGVRQAQADYVTTYSYGMKGAQEVLDRLPDGSKVLLYEGAILGPYNAKRVYFIPLEYRSRGRIVHALQSSDADYFIAGLPLNTLDQLIELQYDRELKSVLATQYIERRLGDFSLYQKRRS